MHKAKPWVVPKEENFLRAEEKRIGRMGRSSWCQGEYIVGPEEHTLPSPFLEEMKVAAAGLLGEDTSNSVCVILLFLPSLGRQGERELSRGWMNRVGMLLLCFFLFLYNIAISGDVLGGFPMS